MNKIVWIRNTAVVAVVGVVAYFIFSKLYVQATDVNQLGGPVAGLTPEQLRFFYATRENFKHEFTPEEGLGPVFNGRSCFECHGQPGTVGGEGRDVGSTGVVRIANRLPIVGSFGYNLIIKWHKNR